MNININYNVFTHNFDVKDSNSKFRLNFIKNLIKINRNIPHNEMGDLRNVDVGNICYDPYNKQYFVKLGDIPYHTNEYAVVCYEDGKLDKYFSLDDFYITPLDMGFNSLGLHFNITVEE